MLEGSSRPIRVESEPPLFADVIVPRHFDGPFTYLIPSQLRPILRIGDMVFVPFGRSVVRGAVIALGHHCPPTVSPDRLKPIRACCSPDQVTGIAPHVLQLAKSVAESYVAPWGQCLRLVLPPKSSGLDHNRLILTKEGEQALVRKGAVTRDALRILQRLKRRPLGMSMARLTTGKPANEEVLRFILDRGWARRVHNRLSERAEDLSQRRPAPDLFASNDSPTFQAPSISPYLQAWQARVAHALDQRRAARLLVQAAPAERLLLLRAAAARTVAQGRRVLVMTGDTARAESLAAALQEPGWAAVVLHSMMPDNKRAVVWNDIADKQVPVVVGTRAAVFLPLDPIGLIWVDREEDPALKEPMEPRYHAREVAWMRARQEQAVLVVASSHLSLEASAEAAPEDLLIAPENAGAWPQIEVVDLRQEDRRMLMSSRLHHAMRDAIGRQAGVALFLNRRAYAGALVCRDCGQVPRCQACAVAFAFSRQKQLLFCHYCGCVQAIPDLCAACSSAHLQPVGEGTERLEEEVKRRFPSARVLRVDGETLRTAKQAAGMRARIHRREWDVLVGTQVLLREDAVPEVALAAAVQADAGLSLPDFRAAERTYHLLQDAAHLVAPMSAGGRLIIQSYVPSHHVIQAVAKREPAIFISEELAQRTTLAFPPAVRLMVLHVCGGQESMVERASQDWATRLNKAEQSALACGDLTILGPVQSPVARIRGQYRRQILLKSHSRSRALDSVRSTLNELEATYARRTVKFDVDVDPIDML